MRQKHHASVPLPQAAIPISMAISKRLLGARYTVTQYAGAAVVASGIIVAIGPSLAVGSGNEGQELLWSVVMVLGCIPMALSSVYKEMALGESELDPIYLNGWVPYSRLSLYIYIHLIFKLGDVGSRRLILFGLNIPSAVLLRRIVFFARFTGR